MTDEASHEGLVVIVDDDEGFRAAGGTILRRAGYLVKPFARDEVLGRVRALMRRSQAASAVASTLTGDERDLIRLLRAGLGADEIGTRLGRPPESVREEIDGIFQKVGV